MIISTYSTPKFSNYLILYFCINLFDLSRFGKAYPWQKPNECPSCSGRIWGHGFVSIYFSGFPECLYLKRYRCPDCRSVFRIRPDTHWSRFQYSARTILESIEKPAQEIESPQAKLRRNNWIQRLKSQTLLHLGVSYKAGCSRAFQKLSLLFRVPVCRVSNSRLKPFGYLSTEGSFSLFDYLKVRT